jgi:hypothetical protein
MTTWIFILATGTSLDNDDRQVAPFTEKTFTTNPCEDLAIEQRKCLRLFSLGPRSDKSLSSCLLRGKKKDTTQTSFTSHCPDQTKMIRSYKYTGVASILGTLNFPMAATYAY